MAEVKRSTVEPAKVGAGMQAKPTPPPSLTLPTTPDPVAKTMDEAYILIHGEKKIGKTTLATAEKNVFLLTFDPKQKFLEVLQRYCPDWTTFMGYLGLLEKQAKSGDYPYKRVVLDGCDIWYRACQTAVEKKLVVDHVSEEKWGRGWDLLKFAFSNAVDRLMALPGGCWFISHSEWRETEQRDGRKIEKLVPQMKGGGESILVGRVDAWFAYDYVGKERVMIVRGDERTGAGNRMRGHFLTPDGRQVYEVPMGSTEFEAWENLRTAFDNRQPFTTLKERNEKKGGQQTPQPVKK